MEVGVSGRHGNHAVWPVVGETGHVFAHALIQRQNGTEWIAKGQISQLRTAISTIVQVDHKKIKTPNRYTLVKAFMSWIVFSNLQCMAIGASGRHGNHVM